MRFPFFVLPVCFVAVPALAQEAAPADTARQQTADEASSVAAEFVAGIDFQEGDYFTGDRVKVLSVQNIARLRAGRTTFSASLPWQQIEAPGNVVGGGGGVPGLPIIVDPTRPNAREVRRGIGDLRLGVGHSIPLAGGVEFTLSGQVKLPTASAERGMGTGKTDFAVGGELARSFGPLTPYVSAALTMPGDPAAYELRNSLSAQGGVALQLGRGLRGNVSYGYAQNVSPLVPDEQQVSTGLNADLSRTVSLGIHGNAGLSSGSPDIGAGVSLGIRIF